MNFLDKVAEHRLSHFVVGDDPVAERTDRDDVARSAAEHALGVIPDSEHEIGARLHRHDGRFAEDDSMILDIDQGIGGTEIDADVAGKCSEKFADHEV